MKEQITAAVQTAVRTLYNIDIKAEEIPLQKTMKGFDGDLTVVTFAWSKQAHKSPEAIGQEIGQFLLEHYDNIVSSYNTVKGFLNLSITDHLWVETLNRIDQTENFGIKKAEKDSPLVMIEYSSPNTNKPLHLGHVRNNLLGFSISEILKANGYRVVRTNIVNDRGIHICKSMLAWQKWGNGETPESSGKKGDHLVGDYYVIFDKHYKEEQETLIHEYSAAGMDLEAAKEKAKNEAPLIKEAHNMLVKWENGDEDIRTLWARMNGWVYKGFDETYQRMGVAFDKIYYESQTYLLGKSKVEEGLKNGIFYRRDDGSIWANLEKDGLDEKLLIRQDGTSVYMTQDIGTATIRFKEYPIDKMIYVVGNEQNYHFQVLSILLDRLGFKWGKELVHFSYGMVELPNGKMKSREGTVVDADDLMDEMVKTAEDMSKDRAIAIDASDDEKKEIARIVGLGALKYFILKVDPRKNMLFNPAESIDFNGNTGPFIQYTYARIRSLMRKAQELGLNPIIADDSVVLNEKETQLIQLLSTLPSVIEQAGSEYSPSLIANYAYEVAKNFNGFYHDFSILKEENVNIKNMRLILARSTAKVIQTSLSLLGMEVPERM